MPTVFSQIIAGDLPGRFVWRDEDVVAFLSIAPLRPGHTLVVPVREVDHWIDADADLLQRCMEVAQQVGRGVCQAFGAPRAGVVIAGFEVPHMHIHVFPCSDMADFDFHNLDSGASAESLDEAADRLRAALRSLGLGQSERPK